MWRKFSYLRLENLKKYPSCHYNFEYFKKKNKNNKKKYYEKKNGAAFSEFHYIIRKILIKKTMN